MLSKRFIALYLSNTSWLLGEQIFSRVLGLITSILLSRYLGANDFGLYSYAVSLFALFALLSNLGIDDLVVRALVSNRETSPVVLGTAFVMKLLGSLLTFGLVAIVTSMLTNNPTLLLLVFILSTTAFFSCFSVIELYLQATVRARLKVTVRILSSSAYLILFVFCITKEFDMLTLVSLSVFQACILSIGLLFIYTIIGGTATSWRFCKKLALDLFKEAWPLIIAMGLVSIYISCDKIIIQNILGNKATGEYSIASKLSEASYFIPTAILASIMPAIVKIKNDKELYYNRLQSVFNLMVVLAIITSAGISILSNQMIQILFGEEYAEASKILSIHTWAAIFVFLGTASGKWMVIEGLSKLYLYRSLLGVIINIVVGIILVQNLGATGAAYATIIAQFFVVIAFDAYSNSTRKIFWMKLRAFSPIQWAQLATLFLAEPQKKG